MPESLSNCIEYSTQSHSGSRRDPPAFSRVPEAVGLRRRVPGDEPNLPPPGEAPQWGSGSSGVTTPQVGTDPGTADPQPNPPGSSTLTSRCLLSRNISAWPSSLLAPGRKIMANAQCSVVAKPSGWRRRRGWRELRGGRQRRGDAARRDRQGTSGSAEGRPGPAGAGFRSWRRGESPEDPILCLRRRLRERETLKGESWRITRTT